MFGGFESLNHYDTFQYMRKSYKKKILKINKKKPTNSIVCIISHIITCIFHLYIDYICNIIGNAKIWAIIFAAKSMK